MNVAQSSNTRLPSFRSTNVKFVFLSSILGPVWESAPWIRPEKISEDGGLTFNQIADEVIFGTYFFLDDVKIVHEMNRYTIIDLLSDFGGLLSSAIGIIGGILAILGINRLETASKII